MNRLNQGRKEGLASDPQMAPLSLSYVQKVSLYVVDRKTIVLESHLRYYCTNHMLYIPVDLTEMHILIQ